MKNSNNQKLYYNPEFLEEKVFPVLNCYLQLGVDIDRLSKYSKKEKHALEMLKLIYSEVKLFKDYKSYELESFSIEKALSLANEYLVNLFPSRELEILHLNNIINFSDVTIYDSVLNYSISNQKVKLNYITVPNIGNNYIVSTIAHEKMHAITFQNIDLLNLFQNGIELFPMLIQKIILYESNDDFSLALERIVRVNDSKEHFNSLNIIKLLKNSPNKTEIDAYVCKYLYIKVHEYLIGELYSNLLLKYYILDKQTMLTRLNQLLDGKITIRDFLNSYDINLLNKDLIPTIKEETNKCKRINILL